MYNTMEQAATNIGECKDMLVKIQSQLNKMEKKQNKMARDFHNFKTAMKGANDSKTEGTTLRGGPFEKSEDNISQEVEGGADIKTPSRKGAAEKGVGEMKQEGFKQEQMKQEKVKQEEVNQEEMNQEEEDVGNHGGKRKLALAAMVGGSFLVGGALQHHLRLLLFSMKSVKKVFHGQVRP